MPRAEAWERATSTPGANKEDDQGYVVAMSHPLFEDIAKQMLRTDRVCTIENAFHSRPPADAGPQQ